MPKDEGPRTWRGPVLKITERVSESTRPVPDGTVSAAEAATDRELRRALGFAPPSDGPAETSVRIAN
jgi:hypothetical protein